MQFGGIDPVFTSFKTAPLVVVPVPYDLTSTYQSGSRRGPAAILEASANMEIYDEELHRETYRTGIHTVAPLDVDARGPKEMTAVVRRSISEILAFDKIPVMLGGEHSITLGAVLALREKFPDLSVLQLDAHADMRETYQGSPYSHACVARRIFESCQLVQAGIRSLSAEESEFMGKAGIKTYGADFILDEPDWIERICENLAGDVYVTIDLDVLDPAVMPSTGTPEPGGISWRALIGLIREVSRRCPIRGFDVVELSPIPGIVAPDFLAAKLVYRIMGYLTQAKAGSS
ncbi:MAG: agmatinase [Syntrophales bacterium LBB04]|nr:agmatinase [Syntrophales bacterium LBB04]